MNNTEKSTTELFPPFTMSSLMKQNETLAMGPSQGYVMIPRVGGHNKFDEN